VTLGDTRRPTDRPAQETEQFAEDRAYGRYPRLSSSSKWT